MKRVLIGVAVAVAIVAALLAVPVTHSAERSRLIASTPTAVWAHFDDLHRLEQWMPVRHRAAGTSTFDGPDAGPGAAWSWKTDRGDVSGLRITDSKPNEIRYQAQATSRAHLIVSLKAEGTGTRVTLRHEVVLSGWHKLVPLVRSVDSVVGPDLEQDLAALAAALESTPR